MKNPSLILTLFIVFSIVVSSCYKEPEPLYVYLPSKPLSNNLKKIEDFNNKNTTKFQVFKMDASQGGIITSANGVKYTIPAYAFETSSGMPVTGNITISIKEIFDPADMILSNKPTVAANGGILESYGEFLVKVQQNNQNLRMRFDSAQTQNAIQIALRNNKKNDIYIPLWEGDTSIIYTQSGHSYENQLITKSTTIPINRGIEWNQLIGKTADANPDTIRFKLPSLFKWANCDFLANYTGPKTTVICYFENIFNNEPYQGSQFGEVNMCVFKLENQNTLIKFSNTIFDAPLGKEGFLSYQNLIPVGVKGTFFVMSVKDEKFYCQTKSVTIDAPLAGKNYTPISFQLKEVTETELLSAIKSMNQ